MCPLASGTRPEEGVSRRIGLEKEALIIPMHSEGSESQTGQIGPNYPFALDLTRVRLPDAAIWRLPSLL